MADTDYSALAATNTIAATDGIVLVRGGVPYRFTGTLPIITAAANFGWGDTPIDGYGRSLTVSQGGAHPTLLHQSVDTNDERFYILNNLDRPTGGFAGTFQYRKTGAAGSAYQQSAGRHIFLTAAVGTAGATATMVESARLDESGNLGLGTTNPGGWRINARQGSTSLLALENTAGVGATIQLADTSYSGRIVQNAGAMIIQVAGTTEAFRCDTSGSIIPGADNARNLGSASRRFGTVYAATSTINTSDAALKTVRGEGELTAEEIAWARAIRILPYRFNDAIAAKGDAARLHFGVLAQEVHAAGLAAGIEDPFAYAFLCRDPLMAEVEVMEQVRVQKTEPYERDETTIVVEDGVARALVRTVNDMRPVFEEIPVVDEHGAAVMLRIGEDAEGAPIMQQAVHLEPVMVTIEQPVTKAVPALDDQGRPVERWGIRYEELAMFLLAASARQA
ncbi:hypothetical protein HNP52_000356 [Sphingomonas kyeonggiensis]|uniref:Peptidase S74 domain-containing protein n=1 Tax=Sphingomonas kyeonggiensis TaxID=1268553 RepID=A0A7W7NPN7_9SPHN|nr:tail fiber domain-containing protein [Sphingomonas kyeonggiensis]MBB4837305.1 hypothetical protein [Sphingomonas kyeonggiensis]